MRQPARKEPGTKSAAILAVGVHVLFLGLLIFGVDWKTQEPTAVIVELWNRLPSPKTNETATPEPPKEAPPPEPKVEPKPEPKAKPKVESKPEPSKADIQLKEKQEREKARKLKEEDDRKKQLLVAKEKERKLKDDEEKKKLLAAKELKDTKAQEKKLQDERTRLEQQQMAAQLGAYIVMIQNRIRPLIIMPPDIVGNPQAEFEVVQIPSGDIIKVTLIKSSGNTAYDAAVERALNKAGSLPLPKDPTLFQRELHLKFRPILQ